MLSPERVEALPLHVVALLAKVWGRVEELADTPRGYFGMEIATSGVITNEYEFMGYSFDIVERHGSTSPAAA